MSVCSSKMGSNDLSYLSQIRQAVKDDKEFTRKEIQKLQKRRNSRIKNLLEADDKSDVPTLYEVRVSVDKDLRDEAQMKKEKRGRVFVEIDGDSCQTLDGLEKEIRDFFPALKNRHLSLCADFPLVLEDGSIFCPGDERGHTEEGGIWQNPYDKFWPVKSDENVIQMFQKSRDFFATHNAKALSTGKLHLKRPSILVHVMKDNEEVKSLSLPLYLEGMPDPKETEAMTMLSFYSFPPGGLADPEEFAAFLNRVWEPFGALGRVYIANEGINAQMSVPTNV